jgi:hypothetical protein
MMTRWLEFLESITTSRLALVVALMVIVGQLVAVGAVASEQVQKGHQRELALIDQRQQSLRCVESSRDDVNCPRRVIYVAHR